VRRFYLSLRLELISRTLVGVKKYMVGAVPRVEYFGLLLLLQRSQKVMDEDAMGAV
jgi:hypothetical protein